MFKQIERNLLGAFALCGLAAMALPSNAASASFERIKTEEEFQELIVGKQLAYDDGAVVVFLADQTFGGGFSGSDIWGEWVWREDRICHQMNVGKRRYKVDCRVPEVDGKRVRFIREDGTTYGVAKIR